MGSRIHQQRDRARGRAWKEERDGLEEAHGAIFAFEFLEASQEFAGLVQVRGKDSAACDELVTGEIAVGGTSAIGRGRFEGTATMRTEDGRSVKLDADRPGDEALELAISEFWSAPVLGGAA